MSASASGIARGHPLFRIPFAGRRVRSILLRNPTAHASSSSRCNSCWGNGPPTLMVISSSSSSHPRFRCASYVPSSLPLPLPLSSPSLLTPSSSSSSRNTPFRALRGAVPLSHTGTGAPPTPPAADAAATTASRALASSAAFCRAASSLLRMVCCRARRAAGLSPLTSGPSLLLPRSTSTVA